MLELAAAVLALLALAFALGRRSGLRQGERLGQARAPLELRIRALEGDRCPVCGQEVDGGGRSAPTGERDSGGAPPPGQTGCEHRA